MSNESTILSDIELILESELGLTAPQATLITQAIRALKHYQGKRVLCVGRYEDEDQLATFPVDGSIDDAVPMMNGFLKLLENWDIQEQASDLLDRGNVPDSSSFKPMEYWHPCTLLNLLAILVEQPALTAERLRTLRDGEEHQADEEVVLEAGNPGL